MSKSFKRYLELVIEKVMLLSGSITSLAIILIVIFLFKEGVGFFSSPQVEHGVSVVLNSSNIITRLSPDQMNAVFDGDVTNWKELGGNDTEIVVFHLNDVTNFVTEDELGAEMENLGPILTKIISENPGMIAFYPTSVFQAGAGVKLLDTQGVDLNDFFIGKRWFPTSQPAPLFGVMPLILGTLWVSFFAILIALPFGLAVAIYLAELANSKVRKTLKPIIELLSGIPSVVYGFFGLIVVVPFIRDFFGLDVGETALAGSIILAIMALPTIITVGEDAIRNVPQSIKENSLALGATHWQTIWRVVLPYAISGIVTAAVLGIGRAIGETMAVLMVTGNSAVIPNSLLQPVRTIPATIAAELGEAPQGGIHYEALFLLGIILFLITLVISVTVEFMSTKAHKQHF